MIACNGLIKRTNARQEAIEEARRDARLLSGATVKDVFVYNAFEINYNPGTRTEPNKLPVPDKWCAVNSIVPNLVCDLYSWSNWSSKVAGKEFNVIRGLDYYQSRLPLVDPQNFGSKRIYMGEYGAYESSSNKKSLIHTTESDIAFSDILARQMDFAWRWGCKLIMHWQIYDHGLREQYEADFDYRDPFSMTEDKFLGAWLIRPAPSPNGLRHFTSGYTFTTAYYDIKKLNERYQYEDEIKDFNRMHYATIGGLIITNNPQLWDEADRSRVYRREGVEKAAITYKVNEPIIDFNLKVFINSKDASGLASPAGRLRWYTSVNGSEYVGPFEFYVVDAFKPNSTASTWTRLHLGADGEILSSTIPPGSKYLRIEFFGSEENTKTQIGNIKIHTLPIKP